MIWIPTPICHIYWNNHQKLSQLTLKHFDSAFFTPYWFWMDAYVRRIIYMKFHIIIPKYLVNIRIKACFKIMMIDKSNMHFKKKSHYFEQECTHSGWFTGFICQSPWKWDWSAKQPSFDNLINGNDPEVWHHWPLTGPRAMILCLNLDFSHSNVSLLTGFL